MYAGVNGNPTTQGNPPKIKASPRVGVVYSINHRHGAARRLRHLLGAVQLPGAEHVAPATTARSASRRTRFVQQTAATPTVTLDNPFPNGVLQPTGSSLGALSGAERQRQLRRSESQRAARPAVVGRPPARARQRHGADVHLHGRHGRPSAARRLERRRRSTSTSSIRSTWRSAARRLQAAVPNPFFGNPNVPASLSTPTTITRAQLLMPFPQFAQVQARQVTEGSEPLQRRRRRVAASGSSHGWGGRVSYTYSVLKDNQFGETNFYSAPNGANSPINNYNYIPSAPACAAGSAVHHRLLRSARGIRLRHPRRAAPHHHRADRRAAVRQGQEVREQQRPRRRTSSAAGRSRRSRPGRRASR